MIGYLLCTKHWFLKTKNKKTHTIIPSLKEFTVQCGKGKQVSKETVMTQRDRESMGSWKNGRPRFGGRGEVMETSQGYTLEKVAKGSRSAEKLVQSPQST